MSTALMKNVPTTLSPVSEITPPVTCVGDAEVDIEVLRLVPKQFAVVDEKTANWVIKKIVAARLYGEHIKEWFELERRRAEREEQTLLFLFERQLKEWTRGEIEKLAGKRKSLNLPAGTLGFRSVAANLQVDDEPVVIRWAKENCPSAILVVEKLSKTELKKYFEETGALPDSGAHIEPGGERFFVR